MSYKKTDALMRHLRNSGISIKGSVQKRQLINTGYYHGYKGYRFFGNSRRRLPFISYNEIYYGKMMFIETAVKNIALERILINSNSESIQAMLDKVISSYHNAPSSATQEQRKRLQQNKLNLNKSIQISLANAYNKGRPQITHFYNNAGYAGVPIWSLFEIMTMGDFGYLLSCLTFDVRDDISRHLGLNLSADTNRELIYKYMYTLKDLRNAIAHNAVVFDTRFRNIDPSRAMKQCLMIEIGLPYINFKTIGDYVILICYYMHLLHLPKTEIKAFIREFERIIDNYKTQVSPAVSSIVLHPDLQSRLTILKNYI